MNAKMLVIIPMIVLIISWVICFIVMYIFDNDEIDNSDGNIECARTGKPCVKTKLHNYYNDCYDCPLAKEGDVDG